jgi:hypothetical protein
MADCKFCGKPAGFLRAQHPECAAAHKESLEKLPQIFTGYINLSEAPDRPNALQAGVEATAKEGFLSADEYRSEIIKGLGLAIHSALTDRSLTDAELARIQEIMNQFGLETADIVASGAHDLLVQGLDLAISAISPPKGDAPKSNTFHQLAGRLPLSSRRSVCSAVSIFACTRAAHSGSHSSF